jgi:hypothetical protein
MDLIEIMGRARDRATPGQVRRLRSLLKSHNALRWPLRSNLSLLARIHETDKWGGHWYTQHYQAHFHRLRKRRLNLLEIGVGGYGDPRAGGESLRMWKDYFPKANIYGIDIFDKSGLQEPRIRIFQGSQADPDFLRWVASQIGRLDIVIDDGSHLNEHMVISFQTLFPLLAEGGFYAIEDLHAAYMEDREGSEAVGDRAPAIALCKRLVDGLNGRSVADHEPACFDEPITSIHFYPELVIFHKGPNRSSQSPESAESQT